MPLVSIMSQWLDGWDDTPTPPTLVGAGRVLVKRAGPTVVQGAGPSVFVRRSGPTVS